MSTQTKAPPPVAKPPMAVQVVVPVFLPKLLSYAWLGHTAPKAGQLVAIEVGKKKYHGMVVGTESSDKKLKPANPKGLPCLPNPTVKFLRWVARYTLSAPGEPLRALLIQGHVPPVPKPVEYLHPTGTAPESAKQQKVLETMASTHASSMAHLAHASGVSAGVIKTMLNKNMLEWREEKPSAPAFQFPLTNLNAQQQKAATAINARLHGFHAFLLDGITGSGKTEVYFAVIEEMLKTTSHQALVMVPEIALTPQWLERFKKRFGFTPAVWHSGLSPAGRQRTWWQVQQGQARVVVGARSALFLPFSSLGFVVVDEEHDASYKQDQKFRYHGRDMAVVLAKMWQCPCVLASATPSLETIKNVHDGRYEKLTLTQRHAGAKLPDICFIDMRQEKAETYLSETLVNALKANLKKGEQSLLFLNRRGVAPLLICRTCGHRHDCPRCDASLVAHGEKVNGKLTCHHCGYSEPWPETCPKCESENLHPFGPGTRKVLAEVQALFPTARTAVADSDAITTATQMAEFVAHVQAQKIDLIVGTQMVTKGHDFPALTCVGVLDADMGLAHGDLRAAERTFQILTQVAGRAGRGQKAGQIYVQTCMPEHPLMKAFKNYDRDAFYAHEMAERKTWGWPPYGRLVALTLSSKNATAALQAGQALAKTFPETKNLTLLGPAPAPLFRLNDTYRFRLLVKSPAPAHEALQKWLQTVRIPNNVDLRLDVDPS